MRQPPKAGWRLMALLIVMSSIGPLSVNIIVPALPGLTRALEADPSVSQLTISLYFAGLACAQLMMGALSDRFGRRPVLLAGFLITVVTSIAAASATNIVFLVVARTIQAFGAATGIVVGRAIVRDIYARDKAASMLGWVTMSVVAIPMFGPLLGGVLEMWWGWRAIFLVLGAATLLTLIWAAVALPETRPPNAAAAQSIGRLWSEARALLLTPAFAGFVIAAGMISGPFYTILGGGPHVVITLMGRSAAELGAWFAFVSFGYMLGNFLAGRFSVRYGVNAMVWWGLLIELVATLVGVVMVALLPDGGPWVIFVPLLIVYVGNGVALPNAIAGAVSVRSEAAGTASGVAGFVQMGCGALISQFISYPLEGATTAMPLVVAMVAQGVAGLVLFWLLVRPSRPS